MKQNWFKIIIVAIYLLLFVVTGYHFYYAKKIVPGVYVGTTNLGGLTYDQAYTVLKTKVQHTEKTLTLTYQDQIFEFDGTALGLEYLPGATTTRAFEIGRTGNLIVDTKDKIVGVIKPLKLDMQYNLPRENLSAYLSTVKAEINKDPKNAYFMFGALSEPVEDSDKDFIIIAQETGLRVDDQEIYDIAVLSLSQMSFTSKPVAVYEVAPEITQADLETIRSDVLNLSNQKVTIIYEDKTWAPQPNEILGFLKFKKPTKTVEITLDNTAFETYAQKIAFSVNKLPRGFVTQVKDSRVVGFEFTEEGFEVDTKTLIEDFSDALFNNKNQVAVQVTKVDTLQDPAKYGIFALLGEGTSKYTGSAPGRIQNLTLAAQRTSGVLVPPGEIYSFNNSVGPISGATGYASAYIISGGRTVLGDGGGVCQTSTTLFRAALNAGLPIITRNPHAYRVVYYEIDSHVGLDAAIFQPSLDFQFKNDTAGYVLVQYFVNEEESLLGFRLYGTPDGREVEITEPVVTNQIAPPAALYQDDSTLAKGVVRQVDFAAWGATASFNRKVTRGDEVLYDSTFTTRYQPWRAVFLVGTN